MRLPVEVKRAAARAYPAMRQRTDRILPGVAWARIAPQLLATFGTSEAFQAASEARIGYEVGRLLEHVEQRRRAGRSKSPAKVAAARRNGRRGGRPRERPR